MPLQGLTPDIKRKLLATRGLSPDDGYDILENGEVVQNDAGQPSATVDVFDTIKASSISSQPKGPSNLESFGRAAAEGAIPAAAGLGAAAIGVGLAPATGGLSLAIPLALGLGGAMGASALQRKVVPQGVQEAIFTRPEDAAENPVATFAGGLAPNALAFNPLKSLAATPTLLGGLRKVPTMLRPSGVAALTPAEHALLVNAGINTAVAGGQEVVDVAMGGEFRPGRFAANAVAPSLLLSRPTALGRRMGFSDIPQPTRVLPDSQPPSPAANPLQELLGRQFAEQTGVQQQGLVIGPEGESYVPGSVVGSENLSGERIATDPRGPVTPVKGAASSAEVMMQERANPSAELKQQDYVIMLREKAKQDAQAEYEAAKQEAAKGLLTSAVARPEQRPRPIAETPTGKELYPDYTGVTEHDAAELAAQPKETEAEYQQRLFEEGKRRQDESALPPQTSEEFRALEDAEARRRGYSLQRGATDISGLGEANLRTRTAKLSPRAAPDTAGHEVIGHGYVNDLIRSAAPRDVEMALEGIRHTSGRTDITDADSYLKLPESERATIEENFAQALGKESFRRKKLELYGTKREKFVDWWNDVKSRFSKSSTERSVRQVGSRGRHDAPYGDRPELMPTQGQASGSRAQQDERESSITPQQDKILRNFYSAANKVASLTKYGDHPHTVPSNAWLFVWSNNANKWIAVGRIDSKYKGQTLMKDSDRFIASAANRNEAELIAQNLPELPLAKNAFERNPLSKIGQQEVLYDDVVKFYEQMQEPPKSPDVIDATSKFMDKIRSPEQTRQQNESALPNRDDYAEYQAVQAKMIEMIKSGDTGGEEFRALWQQNEDIKNRHGGMPPKPSKFDAMREAAGPVSRDLGPETEPRGKEDLRRYRSDSTRRQDESALGPEDEVKPKNYALARYEARVKDWWVGNVDADDVVYAKQDRDSTHPQLVDAGVKLGNLRQRWRYDPPTKQVVWSDTPTPDSKVAVENWLAKKGIANVKHNIWLDGADYSYGKRSQETSALTPEEATLPERTGRRSFNSLLTSRYDKVAERHKSPTGRYVADKFHRFQAEADYLEGQTGNKLIAATEGYTPEQIDRVYRYRHAKDADEPAPFELTPAETQLKTSLDAIYREIGQRVIDSGLRIQLGRGNSRTMRLREEGYQQNTLSSEVAYAWAENTPKAREYDTEFLRHAERKGIEEGEAKELLEEYKAAIGNAGITPDIKFGAIRKVEGIGLPWSLVEHNFNAAASRYGKRVAADLSFFKNIQNDPKMLRALGLRDQTGKKWSELPEDVKAASADMEPITSSEAVKQALRSVYGVDLPSNPRLMAAARGVASMVMQTGTAVRNLLQIPTSIAPYYGVNMSSVFKAASKMNDRTQRAFESNAIRSSFKDFDAAGNFDGNPIKFIRYADKFSAFMRKYTGRDLSDRLEGLFHYSLGEELATNWFAQAKDGDIKARAMLQRFGTTLPNKVNTYFARNAAITADDVSRVAKSFVDAARGTYSASGLPSSAIEGNVAPFLALSRWSVERSNTFWRDVVEPLKNNGDWMPLLKTSLSAIMTGAAIEQLNEVLSGKRGSDPTIKEALADGDADTLAAKAVGLAQLGSLGGIVSDAAKIGMNVIQGKGVKYNNPLSMPLVTAVEDLTTRTVQMKQAIEEGEDPFEVLGAYIKDIVVQNNQNARYLNARTVGAEEAARKEKFRDVRVFEELTDRRQPQASYAPANPYGSKLAREFKQTDDLAEGLSMVPKLVEQAVSNSTRDDGSIDIERLRTKLRSLKGNNYLTFPDALRTPEAFVEYLTYLQQTQGEEQASSRASDFYRQRAINSAKGRAIPSL